MNYDSGVKFWLSDDIFDERIDPEVRRNSFRNSIKDFVKIIVGKEIPVHYTGEKNFTDGKSITIQEEYSREILDTLIGVILHESCHIKLSDFDLFKTLWMKIPREIVDLAKEKKVKINDLNDVYKTLVNYVEDRYIDNWAYSNYIGYRKYYMSLYDDFWNSKEISDVLESKIMMRKENLDSYLYRIINFTNPKTDLSALKGLNDIWKILELKKISRLATPKDRLFIAEKILKEILKNIETPEYDFEKNPSYGKCKGQTNGECSVKQKKKSDVENTSTKQNRENANLNEEIFETDNCVVIKRLTRSILDSKLLPITKISNSVKMVFGESLVSEGISLGKILANRWKIRNESNTLISPNQRAGKINQRRLHLFYSGEERLFSRKTTEYFKKTHIHISIDASGSMGWDEGKKWKNAIVLSVAISKAASMTGNVEVSISFRTTIKNLNETKPCLVMSHDSRRDGFSNIIDIFPNLHPGGETPEGLTFKQLGDHLPESSQDNDTLLIIFSDGMPSVSGKFSGEIARKITKEEYKKLKNNKEIKSLCYYIGDEPIEYDSFKSMYGSDSHWVKVEDILKISKTITDKILQNKNVL